MTNTPAKVNLSNITIKDIISSLLVYRKQISHRVILMDFRYDSINLAVASSGKNNEINFDKFIRLVLPQEALDKSIPTSPDLMADLIKETITDLNILSLRASIVLSADISYNRLIDIPSKLSIDEAFDYVLNPSSGLQIPIPISQIDFDINSTDLLPLIKNKIEYKRYLLTSIPKKSTEAVLETVTKSQLDVLNLDVSFTAQLRLLNSHLSSLNTNEYIILLDLVSECTHVVVSDSQGPIYISRLAAIRNFITPSLKQEQDSLQQEKLDTAKQGSFTSRFDEESLRISKLDIRVLVREIIQLLGELATTLSLEGQASLFLTGPNSQHLGLVRVLGESLNLPVSLISPINSPGIGNVNYDPEKFNEQELSRLLGLGLSLSTFTPTLKTSLSINSNIIEDYSPENPSKISSFLKNNQFKSIRNRKTPSKQNNQLRSVVTPRNESITPSVLTNNNNKNLDVSNKVPAQNTSHDAQLNKSFTGKTDQDNKQFNGSEKLITKDDSSMKKKPSSKPLPNSIANTLSTSSSSQEQNNDLSKLPHYQDEKSSKKNLDMTLPGEIDYKEDANTSSNINSKTNLSLNVSSNIGIKTNVDKLSPIPKSKSKSEIKESTLDSNFQMDPSFLGVDRLEANAQEINQDNSKQSKKNSNKDEDLSKEFKLDPSFLDLDDKD
ncbi:pilus assembly protein PilM [Prochlorococcus sp. MIT 0601]|uniref:pilus assembly protein PilM n=1 Tax=Prochlorococcus sp. MIT 0601 TaxID=1499498 RepID=UPI00053384F1|nr:pilus assembly protein PilM [Prochlorococcus sp. MIT 0601]KGG12521.1 hypothetical protein EV05_1733 [Prochlorococcus sp. MIT 0601]